ncbi:MAG TPA: YihY family inner membrane protein [Pseudomonadales bacterium]|nr:YihY family inner membrane protein [Pseudomonadales bacterium]
MTEPIAALRRRLGHLLSFLRYVASRFTRNGGTETAASLTYTTLFAVVPLMTVTFALLSAIEAFSDVGSVIQDFVFDNFLPSSGAVVQDKLYEFSEQARKLTAVGFAFLIITAYSMLVNVERAFNRIWSVREPRRGMSKFLLYWGILTLSPLLLGMGFAISSYLFSLPLVAGVDQFGVRENLLRFLPFLFSAGAFTVLYSAVPNTRVPLRHAFLGGVITMIAFEGAKAAFAAVMKQTAVEVIYGTFAAVPLFLIWLYLTWTIVLLGAEFTHAVGVRRFDLVDRGDGLLSLTLQFLHRVQRQHRAGGALPDVLAMPVLQRFGPDLLPEVLSGLERADLVRRDNDGNWLPGRDYSVVTVDDVYRALPGYRLETAGNVHGDAPWLERLRERLLELQRTRTTALGVSLEDLFLQSDEEKSDAPDAGEKPTEEASADARRSA